MKTLLLSLLVIVSYACSNDTPVNDIVDGGRVPCGPGYCDPGTVCCPHDGALFCYSDAGECCDNAACWSGEICCGDSCMYPGETCCSGMTCPFESDTWACPSGFSCNTDTCCL